MNFIKTTIVGGIVFLVPLVIAIVIAGKAYELMLLLARPLDDLIPVDTIGGVALANLLAIFAVVAFCFIAGVIARSRPAQKLYGVIDSGLLAIPGYAFIKAYTDGMQSGEAASSTLQPVMVRFDDNAQLGFEVERLDDRQVVVYLPGAPNPWSGSVAYFDADRIEHLDISPSQAINNLRRLGLGSEALLGNRPG
ncbi:MAG: DUF502 domain-containing protein [Gammaproteobacteria bacterium]|nr:DUF502 domain-containing protein [Gammaproteobacteria bacterium]